MIVASFYVNSASLASVAACHVLHSWSSDHSHPNFAALAEDVVSSKDNSEYFRIARDDIFVSFTSAGSRIEEVTNYNSMV